MLWTGVAAFPCRGIGAGRDIVKEDPAGNIVPAMPDHILTHAANVLHAVNFVHDKGNRNTSSSVSYRYTVNHVPLKVDTKRFPEFKTVYQKNPHTMENVIPKELIQTNIGSNRGLLNILRTIFEDNSMDVDQCEKYITINADENIYYRALKVHYT